MAEAVGLCPVWIQAQYFDNVGQPLTGGMIWTYVSSTDETVSTYTDKTGTVQNTNPIILDASGRLQTGIWLKAGAYYGLVLKDQYGQELARVRDVTYQKLIAGDNITLDPASGTGDVTINAAGPYSGNDNGHGPSTMVYLVTVGNLDTGGSSINSFNETSLVNGADAVWDGVRSIALNTRGAYTVQINTKITPNGGPGTMPSDITQAGIQCNTGTGEFIDESHHQMYFNTAGGGFPSQYQAMTFTDVFTVSTDNSNSVNLSVWVYNPNAGGQPMTAEMEVIVTRFGDPYNLD